MRLLTTLSFLVSLSASAAMPEFDLTKGVYEIETVTEGTARGVAGGRDVQTTAEYRILTYPSKKLGAIEAEIKRARLKVNSPGRKMDENHDAAFQGIRMQVALENGTPKSITNLPELIAEAKKRKSDPMFQRYVEGTFGRSGDEVASTLMSLDFLACAKKNAGKNAFPCTAGAGRERMETKCKSAAGKITCQGSSKDSGAESSLTAVLTTEKFPLTVDLSTSGSAVHPGPRGEVTVKVEGKTTRKLRPVDPAKP